MSEGRPVLIVEVFANDIAVVGTTEERDRFFKHLEASYDVGTLRPMASHIGYRVVRDAATGDIQALETLPIFFKSEPSRSASV